MQYYKKKARKPVITETIDYKDTEKLKNFKKSISKLLIENYVRSTCSIFI